MQRPIRASLPILAIILLSVSGSNIMPVHATVLRKHAPIVVDGNGGFTPENGVISGAGTSSDPYMIEAWLIDASMSTGIEIKYTTAHFSIRNVLIFSNDRASWNGLSLFFVSNGRIANSSILNNGRGIVIIQSTNIIIRDNHVTSNRLDGIMLDGSRNVDLSENMVSRNGVGINILWSTAITASRNILTSNGLVIRGDNRTHYNSHNITPDNLVNGRPLYYYTFCFDLDLDRIPIGQLILVGCRNIHIANVKIINTNIAILVVHSAVIRVSGSVIANNGVALDILGSTITVSGNIISSNVAGIVLRHSRGVYIRENDIRNNRWGIDAYQVGLPFEIHRNNFVNNRLVQSSHYGLTFRSFWDNGYPSGGNYWSDYAGVDNCSGPDQDICPNPDGIGDTAYVVRSDGAGALDRYPLVFPRQSYHDSG